MSEESSEINEQPVAKKPKKKGKGLIIALVLVLPILIGGGALAAAKMGVIKIPGLTPAQKVAKAGDAYGDKDSKVELDVKIEPDEEVEETPKKLVAEEPKKPETDPEAGAKKLAGIWNNMEAAQIVTISASYKDEELAFVLSKMEPEVVAEVLVAMPDPKRAAKLSQQIQELASIVPEPAS